MGGGYRERRAAGTVELNRQHTGKAAWSCPQPSLSSAGCLCPRKFQALTPLIGPTPPSAPPIPPACSLGRQPGGQARQPGGLRDRSRSMSRPRKTALPFDTIRTYTFTFHSMYLDIAQWWPGLVTGGEAGKKAGRHAAR